MLGDPDATQFRCINPTKVAKRHSLEAVHVCMQAWRGYRTTESAREAFIVAAQASAVMIVGQQELAVSRLAAERRSSR